MNEATEIVLKVKKEHPEAKGKELQFLVGREYKRSKMKAMRDAGYSYTQIAETLELPESVVRRELR